MQHTRNNECCMRMYHGALLPSRLKCLNKHAVSLQIYKQYNRQHGGAELSISTACIEGPQSGPRTLFHHYVHCG